MNLAVHSLEGNIQKAITYYEGPHELAGKAMFVCIDKVRRWKRDITPHRKLIKNGFELADGKRIDLDEAFKKQEHPFRIAIHDFLYSEATGLPISSCSEAEVGIKSENVFRHVYCGYSTLPAPYYGTHA